jgi:hypothetical protein
VQVSLIENHANFCPFKALRKASIFSKTSCAHGVIAISIFFRSVCFFTRTAGGFSDLLVSAAAVDVEVADLDLVVMANPFRGVF